MNKEELIKFVTFMLFVNEDIFGDDELINDLTDEKLNHLKNRWEELFLPSLKQEHSGDCKQEPWSCIRCYTEELFEQSKRIINLYKESE